jgi:hypothetical protein
MSSAHQGFINGSTEKIESRPACLGGNLTNLHRLKIYRSCLDYRNDIFIAACFRGVNRCRGAKTVPPTTDGILHPIEVSGDDYIAYLYESGPGADEDLRANSRDVAESHDHSWSLHQPFQPVDCAAKLKIQSAVNESLLHFTKSRYIDMPGFSPGANLLPGGQFFR